MKGERKGGRGGREAERERKRQRESERGERERAREGEREKETEGGKERRIKGERREVKKEETIKKILEHPKEVIQLEHINPLFERLPPPQLTYLLKQSCCSRLCRRAPSMAGRRYCEWKLLRLAQLGKRAWDLPRRGAGVSGPSRRGR